MNIIDEGEGDDGWVFVADESSPAGRNEQVQILKDYSNVSLVFNNSLQNSTMNRINRRRNSFYSTSSSEEYYSSFEINESYRSSLSTSIPNSNKLLDFIDLGSSVVDDANPRSDPPPQFLCPITREVMTQPVIAAGTPSLPFFIFFFASNFVESGFPSFFVSSKILNFTN